MSDDAGRTWTSPMEFPDALTGDRHQGLYLDDGRVFLSLRDTHASSPWQGDWVGWIGSWEDLELRRPGQYLMRLSDNHHRWDCAYPAVERLPGGTLVVTTYGHWEEGEQPFIRSIRLTPELIASTFPIAEDTASEGP